jgi:hypothetical protein
MINAFTLVPRTRATASASSASSSGNLTVVCFANANLEPLVEGPAISLAARHVKVRRVGYAR